METISTAGKDTKPGKKRKWTEDKTDKRLDLLEQKASLWDVSKKEYHLKNKRETVLDEIRGDLDIDITELYI